MTQRRANGIAALICSIVLAVVSVRGGGSRDPWFLIAAALALVVATFVQRRRSLLAGIAAACPPTTPARWTTFELASHTTRVWCGVLIVAAVTAALFDGWDFTAVILAGVAAEALLEGEWLRFQERTRGCRLLEEPASVAFERTKEWRPWRQPRAAAHEPTTFYLDPAR